jgi:hypothetical protein
MWEGPPEVSDRQPQVLEVLVTDVPGSRYDPSQTSAPATVWDLLAVAHALSQARRVVYAWHGEPEGDAAGTLDVDWEPGGYPQLRLTGVELPAHVRDGFLVLNLDFRHDPDQAQRHRIHRDGRGVTLCHNDGRSRATYRLPDTAPAGPFTPSQLCAQSAGTHVALAEQLTMAGYPATADEYELGQYQVSLTGNLTSRRGYALMCDWSASPEEARGWFLLPTHRDAEGHYHTNLDRQDEMDLGVPIDASVGDIAAAVVAVLDTIAPHLRAR